MLRYYNPDTYMKIAELQLWRRAKTDVGCHIFLLGVGRVDVWWQQVQEGAFFGRGQAHAWFSGLHAVKACVMVDAIFPLKVVKARGLPYTPVNALQGW